MNASAFLNFLRIRSFRTKLLLSMLVMVFGVSGFVLYFMEENATSEVEANLQRRFQDELNALHQVQDVRYADLMERCRSLSWRPRIHAALEDNALDLLYPSAEGDLAEVMDSDLDSNDGRGSAARFYRFLDHRGRVIPPPKTSSAGPLSAVEEAHLSLASLPEHQEIGYLEVSRAGVEKLFEVIAMPIISTETSEVISCIVLGFDPVNFEDGTRNAAIKSGIWTNRRLHLPGLGATAAEQLTTKISEAIGQNEEAGHFEVSIDRQSYLLVYKRLNALSDFSPAYEVCVYPLSELSARRAKIRWRILGGSLGLLFFGFGASRFLADRFSAPVEELEIISAENLARRERAEAALESTSIELQRSARFSADASHQLKTPVSVLRAGLEEWLTRPSLTVDDINELAGMVHQTYRLGNVIEDLLLLSRIDTGHLRLDFTSINLSELIASWLDDLSALPDPWELKVETEVPPTLCIAGEKRYTTMILQNLLENARKYNCRDGRIRIAARTEGEDVFLSVANTGKRIPPSARDHIFERFHRGDVGENVPGHGLGLNLARELALNHHGDLRLVRSDETWTEFEVRFRSADFPPFVEKS